MSEISMSTFNYSSIAAPLHFSVPPQIPRPVCFPHNVTSICSFRRDERTIIFAGHEQGITMFEKGGVLGDDLRRSSDLQISMVRRIHLIGDQQIYVGGNDGNIYSVKISGLLKLSPPLKVAQVQNKLLDFDVKGGHLIGLSENSEISLFDLSGRSQANWFCGQAGRPKRVKFFDTTVGVASHLLSVHDPRSGRLAASYWGPCGSGGVFTALDSQAHEIFAGTSYGGLLVWDCRAPGRPLHTLQPHTGAVTDIFTQPGQVISSSADGSIVRWDVRSEKVVRETSAAGILCMSIEEIHHISNKLPNIVYATDTGLIASIKMID